MLLQLQLDECLALSSIFPDEFKCIREPTAVNEGEVEVIKEFCCDLQRTSVTLNITLPLSYPTIDSPRVKISTAPTHWIDHSLNSLIQDKLTKIHAKSGSAGNDKTVILFEWVTYLWHQMENEWLRHTKKHPSTPNLPSRSANAIEITSTTDLTAALSLTPLTSPADSLVIFSSKKPLVDQKSTFTAYIAPISDVKEIARVMDHLLTDNKIRRATHRIMAYRVKTARNVQHDFDDDGETGAGARLSKMMELCRCENVMVVVCRWFGGVLLGPARFRDINNVARSLLAEHHFIRDKRGNLM